MSEENRLTNPKPEIRNPNQIPMTQTRISKKQTESTGRVYDLAERSAVFGESVIAFAKRVMITPITSSLISQLVRCATSIGANYGEADDAESKKDFRHKVGICRKESKECKHWLRMMATAAPELKDEARTLWQEAKELNLIFGAIRRNAEK
jgi:four helix bundle protein